MDKKDKKPNVPNLRFNNFSDNWKDYTINDITKSCGGGTPTTKNKLYWDGNIPWISSSDLFDNDIRSININRYITKDAVLNSSTKLCPEGTICIVSRVGVGKVAVSECEICTSQDFMNIIDFNGNNYFLAQLLQNKIKSSQLQGTSIKGITTKEIKDLKVYIPCTKEQDKITQFLSLIDKRIKTQIKIINDYKYLKKGINDKLYYELQCEEMMFSSVYITAKEGGTPSTSNTENYSGNIPFIKIDDLNKKYIISNKTNISEKGLKNSSAWLIPKNSIIMSNGATIGNVSINTYPVSTKQGILGIVPKDYVLTEYLFYLLNTTDFKRRIKQITTKGTIDCAYIRDIDNIIVKIPSLSIQEKTIQILKYYDEKIEVETSILELLQKQKEYMLKSLFI